MLFLYKFTTSPNKKDIPPRMPSQFTTHSLLLISMTILNPQQCGNQQCQNQHKLKDSCTGGVQQ